MPTGWSYADWRPGGEHARFGDITLDSTLHCGNAHDFAQIAPGHYRFRARVHLAPYAWRFLFAIESPGDGREITLEVADFSHEGRTPWHESATAYSTDGGTTWLPFDTGRLEIAPWTPTGHAEIDGAYGDASHVPYGVRYRLRLDAPRVLFASPTPFTLDYRDALLAELAAAHPELVTLATVARSAHSHATGYAVTMARIGEPGGGERRRIFVVAGEHPAESAGMYACGGFLREVLSRPDWLMRYEFAFVPILNVDGVFFGRTYFNVSPGITDGPGVNLSATWGERPAPEQRGLWRLLEELRPGLLVSLHNGRHRRQMDQFRDPGPASETINAALRAHLGFELHDAGPPRAPARLPREAMDRGLCRHGFLTETLLLCRLPGTVTFRDSYVEVGRQLARGYVEGMDAI